MIHRYFPHTQDDIEHMLGRIGMGSLDDLYADVPGQLRMKRPYELHPQMGEEQVRACFAALAAKNVPLTCFAGGGFYDHYCPAVIPHIAARSEYLTAYTPYQPEISQGTLQYIFEYQTMMGELTGLPVSNASMYDGSTALAEAMLMCIASTRRRDTVVLSKAINPLYLKVIATYARWHGVKLEWLPECDGHTDFNALAAMLAKGCVAGVMVQTPNFYGIIEDLTGVADMVHDAKALLVVSTPASGLGVLKSPGEWGADIAAGEAQSLGMPRNFGGPYLGYMCCTQALMRKLPGRIVGATTDARGQRTFVLTLQAREQHIRREKATSNICSNQSLQALWAGVYLSLMGPEGLKEVNAASAALTRSLVAALEATGKWERCYPGQPYLNETVMRYKGPGDLGELCTEVIVNEEILPGLYLGGDRLLVCCTERRTHAEIQRLVEAFDKHAN